MFWFVPNKMYGLELSKQLSEGSLEEGLDDLNDCSKMTHFEEKNAFINYC